MTGDAVTQTSKAGKGGWGRYPYLIKFATIIVAGVK